MNRLEEENEEEENDTEKKNQKIEKEFDDDLGNKLVIEETEIVRFVKKYIEDFTTKNIGDKKV